MKTFLLYASIILIFATSFSCGNNKNETTKINVTVTDSITQDEPMVYLLLLYQNQLTFHDSIQLKKGETNFTFEYKNDTTFFKKEGDCGYYILFKGKNADVASQYLILSPTTWKDIDVKIGKHLLSIEGPGAGEAKETLQSLLEHTAISRKHRDTIATLRKNGMKENELIIIEDSLKKVFDDHHEKSLIYNLENSKYEKSVSAALYVLKVKFSYSDDKLTPYLELIKKRFPDSKRIQAYPEPIESDIPHSTPESIIAFNRQSALLGIKPRPALPDVKAYKMGDIVEKLALNNKDEKLIKISDIKTQYIFIDFWASWCAPCRKESPYLLDAQKEFGDKLTIYAISLDDKTSDWTKAIEEDKTNSFTHVIASEDSDIGRLQMARFGIRGIPANFLLDKDRKIIATNLRHEGLAEKLRELTHK